MDSKLRKNSQGILSSKILQSLPAGDNNRKTKYQISDDNDTTVTGATTTMTTITTTTVPKKDANNSPNYGINTATGIFLKHQ